MKRNIDLTLKRDFNNVNDDKFFDTISRSLHLRTWHNKETPWRTNFRLINDDTQLKDSEMSYDNILITGNKIKRAEGKFYRKIYKNVCDCCGRPLDYIPWKVKYGLCDKCNAVHSIKIDNVPWRNKINSNKRICWR